MTPSEESLAVCICGKPECDTPFGFCHCGCGNRTNTARQSDTARGYVRGMPYVRIHGHNHPTRTIPEDAAPFKIDGVYCRLIPLTKGQYAIMDAADYEWLLRWEWTANWSSQMQSYYVMRTETILSRKQIGRRQISVRMHREILGLKRGDSRQGDHINGNTLDNRRANLRVATLTENLRNKRRYKNNMSGFKGVSLVGLKRTPWIANIQVNGNQQKIGCYKTAEEAYAAYCEAAIKLHGEFARFA